MFSRPDPRELDPNPIMAPWYWIIFGMMMADAGYGLIMALFFGLFLKLKKPRGDFGKLVKVLLYASITTAFWGVMFARTSARNGSRRCCSFPLTNPSVR
jgi:V/A-type H+-transporting ATPase subunit I